MTEPGGGIRGEPDEPGGDAPRPGAESYPLEAAGETAPLGSDPPAPWPPCPACGAPRRLPEPVCLQCGHDERPPGSRGAVGATHEATSPASPMGDDATAVGGGGAAGAAVPGATAGPTATTSPPSSDRDPDLEPLLRRWPGGGRVSWLLAFAVLLVLLFGGLLGVSGFPPALVGEDGTVTLARRLALSFRLIAAAGVWSLAAWGVCLGFAWGQDREVGGRIELGGRMVLVVAASRLAILLPIGEPGLAFLAEGLLVLVILTLGLRLAIRVTWAMAGGLAIMTAFAIGSTALIAHVLAWILA